MSAALAKVQSLLKSGSLGLIAGLLMILVGVTQSGSSAYYDAFYILVGLVAVVGTPWLQWRDERPKKLGLCYVAFATAFGVLAYFSRTAVPFLAGLCVIACLGILAGVGTRLRRH